MTTCQVTVRQPFGTDYTKEPIEVEKPSGSYKGNWNHNDFHDIVEKYYRSMIGNIIELAPGTQNVQMKNIKIVGPSNSYSIVIPD
jgi:hypothetical protein